MKKLLTFIAFVLLSGISHAQSWINLDSLPIARTSRSAAFSIGTKGYILKGGDYSNIAYS